jgi:NADH-quinone oxidoreductase subunit C
MPEPSAKDTYTRNPLAGKTVDFVRHRAGESVLEVIDYRGETTIILEPASILGVCRALRDAPDLQYDFLADITAVDWPDREDLPRFDVVYHLLSLQTRAVIRLKVRVGNGGEEHPVVPSVTSIWPAANWHEREIWDLFGIEFSGHPDLRRILLPEDWVGHPLRKDYPLTGITLPDPHWGGQVPFGQPLPSGIGRLTLRTPGGIPDTVDVAGSETYNVTDKPEPMPNREDEN